MTEGIKPRRVYTLSWTLSWGCFSFLASMILLYKEEEILDGDSADVSSPRDSRWFDHETLCPVVHTLNKTAF